MLRTSFSPPLREGGPGPTGCRTASCRRRSAMPPGGCHVEKHPLGLVDAALGTRGPGLPFGPEEAAAIAEGAADQSLHNGPPSLMS